MTVRLLTNIGRLWTGSEVWSNAAILSVGERIAWVGHASDLPSSIPGVISDIVDVDHVENLNGALVTPGLIDAHTHPVYAGNRWAELAMRASGSTAADIAAAGGGMASTVTVTRGTDPWTLCNGVRERLRSWLASGTTTIEAKTGYHLTRDGELADVRLLRSLEKEPGMPRVHVTLLAAHAVPPEYFGRRHDYVDAVGGWCADAAAAGADSVDVYCDDGRFTTARGPVDPGRRPGRRTAAPAARLRRFQQRRRAARGRDRLRLRRPAARRLRRRRRRPGPGRRGRRGLPRRHHRVRPHAARSLPARQGRRRGPRLRPLARRQRDHLDAAGHQHGDHQLRDERRRGAPGRHRRRRGGACAPPTAVSWSAAGWPTSWPGTPTTKAPSPGPTA